MKKLTILILLLFLSFGCASFSPKQDLEIRMEALEKELKRIELIALSGEAAADTKISDLAADTSPTSDDILVTVDSGTNKKVTIADLFKWVVYNDTDGHTMTVGQCDGKTIVTNNGAGAQTFILPAAAAGLVCRFHLVDAADVNIEPLDASNDQIMVLTDAVDDAISSDATAGSYITLFAYDTTEWHVRGRSGAWTDAD